jgi:hypothetical protein
MSVRVRTGGTVGPSGVWWKTAASQRGGREGKGEEGTQREREGKGEVERSEIKGRGEGGRNGQRDRESERQRGAVLQLIPQAKPRRSEAEGVSE